MISCVTFETAKVVEPALYYEINKFHMIHYVKNPGTESGRIYEEFSDRVEELLKSQSRLDIEIVKHNESVSNFSKMLSLILEIIRADRKEHEGCEIFVNISAGSPEFAAAAAIASMMEGATAFSVGSQEYTVKDEKIREIYFVDGKPVGLTKKTYDPRVLPSYTIEMPPEHLVRALRILEDRNSRNLSVTSGKMVEAIQYAGLWHRNIESSESKKSNERQTKAVYYQRDFITKWSEKGWVVKDSLHKHYVLTDEGRNIINTFYLD